MVTGLGIDLGTANTVICDPRKGVVLDEPSIIALRMNGSRQPKLCALGRDAQVLVGRAPAGLVTLRPLQDGVVTDLELTRRFMVEVLHRLPLSHLQRLRLPAVIGVPAGATTLERRALLESAEEARLGNVRLMPEPLAGALGCGIDPMEPKTRLVVDVGGGTSEMTAFCYGGVVAHRSCRIAGDEMTLAVYQYLRDHHHVVVGELTAEDVKTRREIEGGKGSFVVEGREAATGRPRIVRVTLDEVATAIKPVADAIVQTLASCLEDLPAQAIGDIRDEGVLAFGGGSLTRDFDRLLSQAIGFPVRHAERPLTCVAEGAARCLSHPELLNAFSVD